MMLVFSSMGQGGAPKAGESSYPQQALGQAPVTEGMKDLSEESSKDQAAAPLPLNPAQPCKLITVCATGKKEGVGGLIKGRKMT